MVLVGVALLLGSEAWPRPLPPAPLAGFSFSPLLSESAHHDPRADLGLLLADTNPDLVRLPIYWESVEPTPDQLDFSEIDGLLAVVARHNELAVNPTRVVLTVGARNFLYPELHEPGWARPRWQPFLNNMQAAPAYRAYFDTSITRYRDSPLLYAWQVENEPLDYVGNASTGDDQIKVAQLSWEMGEVRRLDPGHEAMTTTFDGWNVAVDMLQVYAKPVLQVLGGYPSGHPEEVLQAGDALGLDMYIDGPRRRCASRARTCVRPGRSSRSPSGSHAPTPWARTSGSRRCRRNPGRTCRESSPRTTSSPARPGTGRSTSRWC